MCQHLFPGAVSVNNFLLPCFLSKIVFIAEIQINKLMTDRKTWPERMAKGKCVPKSRQSRIKIRIVSFEILSRPKSNENECKYFCIRIISIEWSGSKCVCVPRSMLRIHYTHYLIPLRAYRTHDFIYFD